MLHWLPSVHSKFSSSRKTFFNNIVLLVSIAHIVLLGGGYLVGLLFYKYDTYTISMHQSGATYVLMPLDKQVKQQQMLSSDSNCKQSKIIDYESYQKRKKVVKPGSASVKLQKSKQKSVEQKKSQRPSMRYESSLPCKRIVRSVSKKIKQQKVKSLAQKKSKKNKVKMIEQQEVASTVELEQQAVPAPSQEQIAVKEPTEPLQQPEIASFDTAQDCLDAIDENNVVFIGYEQLDQSIIGSKIQHAIAQSWSPPIGIEPGTSCQVLVDVGSDGCLKSVEIVKSSGKLVYDMCAKRSVDIEYPEQVWNKKFTIVLGN